MIALLFSCLMTLSTPNLTNLANEALVQVQQQKASSDEVRTPKVRRTPGGAVVTYTRTWKGMPVWEQRLLRVHFDRSGKANAVHALPALEPKGAFSLSKQEIRTLARGYSAEVNLEPAQVRVETDPIAGIFVGDALTRKAYRARVWLPTKEGIDEARELIIDAENGQTLSILGGRYYFQTEPEARGWVYSASAAAANLTADADSDEANDDVLVEVPLRGLDGSGFLRGDYVDLDIRGSVFGLINMYSPFAGIQPGSAFSEDGRFFFEKDHPGLAEVNVYYWIDSAQRHIQTLGVEAMQRPIEVLAHAIDGDSAFYSSAGSSSLNPNGRIYFGDGTVQTALDPSIVLHEYSHALLDDLAGDLLGPHTTRFSPTDAIHIHEGFADYMAAYLERALSIEDAPSDLYPDFVKESIGVSSADGTPYHTSLIRPAYAYPLAKELPSYATNNLWASMFHELDQTMGSDTFATLLFESFARLTAFEGPISILDAIHEADQVLHNGAHKETLDRAFSRYKFDQEYSSTHVLSLNQNIELGPGYHLLEYTTGDTVEPFNVRATETYSYLSFRSDTLDGEYQQSEGFTGGVDSLEVMPFAESGSAFVATANTRYEFQLTTRAKVNFSIQAGEAPLPESFALVENQATVVADHRFFVLQSDKDYDLLLLEVPTSSEEFVIRLNRYGPPLPRYTGRYKLPTSLSGPGRVLLPFDFSFRGKIEAGTPIYIELPEIERDAVILWRGLDLSSEQRLEVSNEDAEATFQADETGLVIGKIFLSSRLGQGIMQTDADTPFWLIASEKFFAKAPKLNGVYQLPLSTSRQSFDSYGEHHLGSSLFSGSSFFVAYTTPGSSISVKVEPGKELQATTIAEASSQEITLEPGELRVFEIQLTDPQTGFQTIMTPTSATRLIHKLFDEEDRQVYTDDFFEVNREPASLGFHNNRNFTNGPIEAESKYYHWIVNQSDGPASFTYQQTYSNQEAESTFISPAQETYMVNWYPSEDGFYAPLMLQNNSDVKAMTLTLQDDAASYQIETESIPKRVDNRSQGYIHIPLEYAAGTTFHEEGFPIWLRAEGPIAPDPQVNMQFQWHTDPAFETFEASQTWQPTLSSLNDSRSKFLTDQQTRGVLIGWDPEALPATYQLETQLARNDASFESPFLTNIASRDTQAWLDLQSQQPLQSLPPADWYLRQARSFNRSLSGIRHLEDRSPFQLASEIQFLPMETATRLPVTPREAQASLLIRQIQIINPSDTPQIVQWHNETLEIATGGFIQRNLAANETLDLKAEIPLAIFERQAGEAWETLTAPMPYQHHDLLLPHLPPANSEWTTIAAVAHIGGREAKITSGSEGKRVELSPGFGTYQPRKDQQGSWSRLQTQPARGKLTPEVTISGTQYWNLGGQFAAEAFGVDEARTLYLPHIPDLADGWVGLTLANPSDRQINLTLAPYGSDGLLFDQVRHVAIPANQSTTGLLETLLDPTAIDDIQWMRIHCEDAAFAGMIFFGTKRDGDDVAAFSLPMTTSTGLLFPGLNNANGYEVVITNTVAATGTFTVEAVGPGGETLASFEQTLKAHQKLRFDGEESFPELGHDDYYIRVKSQDIRVSGLIIGGKGEQALSAQTPILLQQ